MAELRIFTEKGFVEDKHGTRHSAMWGKDRQSSTTKLRSVKREAGQDNRRQQWRHESRGIISTEAPSAPCSAAGIA